jgi:DNA polymerase-3 subunit epsilon
MNLSLKKPLAIFDIESTGLNITKDRIVEIAVIRVEVDGTEHSFIKRVNPEMPIPQETSEIHGIYDADILHEPTFKEIEAELVAFIGESDLGGYNSNKFDIPLLAEELLRVGSTFDMTQRNFIDVQNIFHKMEQRTLSAAYTFYCKKDLNNAHSALADTSATLEILKAQIHKYPEVENDADFLANFSKMGNLELLDFAGRLALNKNGEAVYNFGKHKGKTVREVAKSEPGYYGWMLDADFPLYTKHCLKAEMEKIKMEREQTKKILKAKETDQLASKLEDLKNKFK